MARRDAAELEVEENLWGYGKRFRFMKETLRELKGNRPLEELKVLDVGCGNGSHLAIPLAKCGFSVTGIDIDPVSIEQARKLSGDCPRLDFQVASPADLAPKLFHAVILSEVLEHLQDPAALLEEAVGRLEPNGIVLVTVPNGRGEFEIDSWIYRTFHLQSAIHSLKQLLRWRRPKALAATENSECGHVQFFTRRALCRLFRDASLQVIREGVGSFICGPLVGHTLGHSERFVKWNARWADKVPRVMASSWYFALKRAGEKTA